MGVTQTLLALEETFWKAAGDKDAYAANLAPDAEHVFPGWGISEREKVLDSVAAVEPWQSFTIDDLRVIPLGDDAAALVYATRAQRAGQAPYVAAITSVYRRTDSGWELVIHQQTPFEPSPSL